MIGPRIGPRIGSRVGPAVGVGEDQIGTSRIVLPGVTLDAASGKYFPASAAEWAIVLAHPSVNVVSGGPSLLWLCQENASPCADSIGTFAGVWSGATITGGFGVTGYTRKGISVGGATGMIANTDAGLPDLSTTSAFVLTVERTPGSAGSFRNHVQLAPTIAGRAALTMSSSSRITQESGAGANGVGAIINGFSTVIPYALRVNRTTVQQTAFTAVEKNTIAIDPAVTGKGLIVGGDTVIADAPPVNLLMYVAEWFGAAAELTDAKIKAILMALGWSISWS